MNTKTVDEQLILEMLAAGATIIIGWNGLQQELAQLEEGFFRVFESRWEYSDAWVSYDWQDYDSVSAAWQAMKEWAAQPEEE